MNRGFPEPKMIILIIDKWLIFTNNGAPIEKSGRIVNNFALMST